MLVTPRAKAAASAAASGVCRWRAKTRWRQADDVGASAISKLRSKAERPSTGAKPSLRQTHRPCDATGSIMLTRSVTVWIFCSLYSAFSHSSPDIWNTLPFLSPYSLPSLLWNQHLKSTISNLHMVVHNVGSQGLSIWSIGNLALHKYVYWLIDMMINE